MAVVDGSGTAPAVRRNSLLAALVSTGPLPAAVEVVDLHNDEVVHEVGQPIAEVLFPVSCVVSVAMRNDDETLDVTSVGREGMVGLPGLVGAAVHDTYAVCRVPGEALRLPIAAARQLLIADAEGLAVLHRYIGGYTADLMQRITCNRVHSSEARCACWLLKTSDRVGSDAFALTHTTLAMMLGVRRATVTDSLAVLQRREVVRSSRGTLTVLDRAALEAAACDCYATFGRGLPMSSA